MFGIYFVTWNKNGRERRFLRRAYSAEGDTESATNSLFIKQLSTSEGRFAASPNENVVLCIKRHIAACNPEYFVRVPIFFQKLNKMGHSVPQ